MQTIAAYARARERLESQAAANSVQTSIEFHEGYLLSIRIERTRPLEPFPVCLEASSFQLSSMRILSWNPLNELGISLKKP